MGSGLDQKKILREIPVPLTQKTGPYGARDSTEHDYFCKEHVIQDLTGHTLQRGLKRSIHGAKIRVKRDRECIMPMSVPTTTDGQIT